ncbi:MAG TPA: FtsX-like permease family protein [Cyclobacteriaceae bacterium]|nr:FtsX-like permease family protein [Cyclobacteriaceae bacterium]
MLGLATGMASCLLIWQYVSFELSYDTFHDRGDDIYRVYLDIYKNGRREAQSARVSPGVAAAFQHEFPEIETCTRMVILGPDGVLTHGDKFSGESDILLADTAFFDVFSFNLLQGDEQSAFLEPFCVVITENTARAIFGNENPLGESIVINAKNFDNTSIPFKVTGVIENFPTNTHLRPAVLISYPTLFEFVGHRFDDSWNWNETYTYFRLRPNTDFKSVESRFAEVVHRFNGQLAGQGLDWEYQLQPLRSIHLYSDLQHEFSVNGNARNVYFLAAVGILILLTAYFNFINLATIKAMERAREVGIRKISGAYRGQIIAQFILESLLINFISLVAAFLLLSVVTPHFNALFNIDLTFIFNANPGMWIGLLAFLLLLILGSGIYPAFILSRYKPAVVLKGQLTRGRPGRTLRQILTTWQFSVAIILIALTITAGMQIRHMQRQSLGFNPEQIVIIKAPKAYDYGYSNNFSGFRDKLSSISHINSVSASIVIPGQGIYHYDDRVTIDGEETSGVFSMLVVDHNYFAHYQIPLVAGRLFTGSSQDQVNWIINETAVRLLGFGDAEQAVGRKLNNGEIIGVVKDFHHESLKTAIPPMLFNCGTEFNYYSVSLNTGQLSNTLTAIKSAYEKLFPGSPYEYFFLNEFFNRQYTADKKFNDLFGLFSGLAIFIASLGLFGLSSHTAALRTREIGIRKVMGATTRNIISLLSRDYISLIIIASLLALPIAYLIIQKWLENYAYRISIDWWLMLIPVVIVLLIALLTVSLQTVKTALADPVEALRCE